MCPKQRSSITIHDRCFSFVTHLTDTEIICTYRCTQHNIAQMHIAQYRLYSLLQNCTSTYATFVQPYMQITFINNVPYPTHGIYRNTQEHDFSLSKSNSYH